MKKLEDELNKTDYYLQKIKEVYGDLNTSDSQHNKEFDKENVIDNLIDDDNIVGNNNIQISDNNNGFNDNRNDLNINNNNFQNPSTKINLRARPKRENIIDSNSEEKIALEIAPHLNNELVPFEGKKSVIFFGFCLLLSGLVDSLKRPDFPNILEGILVILCCNFGIKNGVTKAVIWSKTILFGDLILILYDCIWLFTHYYYIWIDKYNGGHENLIGFLSVICCGVNVFVKAIIGVMIYRQYSETKKMENENKNNNY